MNINALTGLIPAKFKCTAANEQGELIEVEVEIAIARLSFREATKDDFQAAMKQIDKDPVIIGELLVKCLKKWSLFSDAEGKEMVAITVDNIIDRPVDFVMALVECVMQKLFPNPQKAGNSPDGLQESKEVKELASAAKTSAEDTSSQSPAGSGE